MSDEKTSERWVAKLEDRIARDGINIETANGQRVAYVRPDDTMEADDGMIVECCSKEQQARARLITAAPDLLSSLQELLASGLHLHSDVPADVLLRAHAAVIKAGGK